MTDRRREKLTPEEIGSFEKPGKYSDGEGLYIRVTKTGTRSWVFRFKGRDLGLGKWPDVSLDEARAKAAKKRGRSRKRSNRVSKAHPTPPADAQSLIAEIAARLRDLQDKANCLSNECSELLGMIKAAQDKTLRSGK